MAASDLATVTASTKRPPAVAGGLVGAPTPHLASLPVTPFQSARAELAAEAGIEDPREAKVCHVFTGGNGALPDVREGDVLVVSGVEYPVRSAAEFNRGADSYIRLLVQERKVT